MTGLKTILINLLMQIDGGLKKMIEGNALAVATVGADGNPHCIAVAFVKVVGDDKVLITDNYMKETTGNLRENNRVALAVWNKEWEEDCVGYQLKGTAEYFSEGEWYERIKAMPENDGEPCKGAILVTVNNIKRLA